MTIKIVDFLSTDEIARVIEYAMCRPWAEDSWGRFTCDFPVWDVQNLDWLYEKSANAASSAFDVEGIIPTYYKFCKYSPRYGIPRVPPHIDENACTYTVDIQLDSNIDWSIYIDFDEYLLKNGDAVLYMGEDQLHWRPKFPTDDESDSISMLFMHYAHPNHWFFEYGQDYIYDSDFHNKWLLKMRHLLSTRHHETMTQIDDGVL